MHGSRSGYTVLEIMMTIFILALVCMTTATLLANAHKLNAASSHYVHAYQIAEAIIEEISSLPLAGGDRNLVVLAADPSKWAPSATLPEPYYLPAGAVGLTILEEKNASIVPVFVRVSVVVASKERVGDAMQEKTVRLERLISGNTLR